MDDKTYIYDERKRCYVLAAPLETVSRQQASRRVHESLGSYFKVALAVLTFSALAWALLYFLYGTFNGGSLEIMELPF